MYFQSRVVIRTALVYLIAAVVVGALMMFDQGLRLGLGLGVLMPVFYHLLMVGWTTQLICGVALWLFPAYSRELPHGNERLGWFAYASLNVGLILRAVAEPLHSWGATRWSGWALALSGLLQVLSMWAFVWLLWPRVKGRAERARQPKA